MGRPWMTRILLLVVALLSLAIVWREWREVEKCAQIKLKRESPIFHKVVGQRWVFEEEGIECMALSLPGGDFTCWNTKEN